MPKKPVLAADGYTYEHDNISRWLSHAEDQGRDATSPMTNLPLRDTVLVDNFALRHVIEKFMEFKGKYLNADKNLGSDVQDEP